MVRPSDAEPARPRRTAQRRRRSGVGRAPQWGHAAAVAFRNPPHAEQVISLPMHAIVDGARAGEQPKTMSLRRLAITESTPLHPAYVVWELTLACDQPCTHCGSRAGDARPAELSTA